MSNMSSDSNVFLTGNKDVDRKILSELSDRELLIACNTNKYAQEKVCDETFFRNLVYNRYPETIKYKDYVKVRDWKNFYLSIIYYIDKLGNLDFNYTEEVKKEKNISPELEYLSRKLVPEYYQYSKNRGLLYASREGYLPVVKYLTEHGADIHAENEYALYIASRNGHLAVVKYLVEHETDIHSNNDQALRSASATGKLPVVKYLVKKEADIHVENDDALRLAKRNGHLDVVEYLESLQ